jgi:hypothetical protein
MAAKERMVSPSQATVAALGRWVRVGNRVVTPLERRVPARKASRTPVDSPVA